MQTSATTRKIVTPEQHAAWEQDGFFLAQGLFDDRRREALRALLSDIAAGRYADSGASFIPEKSAPMNAAPLDAIRKINAVHFVPQALEFWGPQSRPAAMAAELIGTTELEFGSSGFTKPAGHGSETPWHQDQALWAIWTPNAVSCWVALDQCTVENGCLQFVKGSHHEGMIPHVSTPEMQHPHIPKERVPQERVVLMEMEPGDAVFFGGRTWHFSESNRSSQRRLGTVAVYNSIAQAQHSRLITDWANGRHALDMSIGQQKKTPVRVAEAVAL